MKLKLAYKINRLFEDLFAPMSRPEQADVDKQFEDVYTLYAELPRQIDQSGHESGGIAVIDWKFVRSRIRQIIRVAGLVGNREKEPVRHYVPYLEINDVYYQKSFSNPEDVLSARDELTNKVIKKLESLKIATAVLARPINYQSLHNDNPRNLIANDVVIKARNARSNLQIKPTLLTLSVKGERRKKLTEDIFQPMSEPEQAEVDKQFKYRIAVGIAAWKKMDKKLSNKIQRMLLANGFKRKKNWGQGVYNWLEKPIRKDKDNYFKVTYGLIMSIMKKEGRSPSYFGDNKLTTEQDKSVKIIDQHDPEVEIYVTVNKKKKNIEEDLFQPMSPKEQHQVETMKRVVTFNIAKKYVEQAKLDASVKAEEDKDNDYYYTHPDTIYQDVVDGLTYDHYIVDDKANKLISKLAGQQLQEDIFQPMRGKELKDVKKKSELSIEMKQAIVKAVKAEWDAVKDSGSQTGVMMHKYLIHPDTIAQNVYDALGIPYDKERYWDYVYAMVIKYDPFKKIAETTIFKPMAGRELKDVKKTLSTRLKVWDFGVLLWEDGLDGGDYVPDDRAEVTAKTFEEAKLLFRNAVKRRYGNKRVSYDWYSDQETRGNIYVGISQNSQNSQNRPMVRWGVDSIHEDIFKPMGKREVGKADKELVDRVIKKYIQLPPEEALWEILRAERDRREAQDPGAAGQGIPMSDWAGDRFAGLYDKISRIRCQEWEKRHKWAYKTSVPGYFDKRRKEAVAEFKKLSPKLDIRELILKVRGL
jgi:hypothetical protein